MKILQGDHYFYTLSEYPGKVYYGHISERIDEMLKALAKPMDGFIYKEPLKSLDYRCRYSYAVDPIERLTGYRTCEFTFSWRSI